MKNIKSDIKYKILKGSLDKRKIIWNNIWFTIQN